MSHVSEIMPVLLYAVTFACGIAFTLFLLSILNKQSDFLVEDMEEKSSIVLSESGGVQSEVYVTGQEVYATIISTRPEVSYEIKVNGDVINQGMLKDYESRVARSLRELKGRINLNGRYKRIYNYDKNCYLKSIEYIL